MIPVSARLARELCVAAIVFILFMLYRQHLLDEGEDRVKAADARAVAAQQEMNALKEAQARAAVFEEKATYVEKTNAPVRDPVPVRLCHDTRSPRSVLPASTPRSGPHASAEVRAEPARHPEAGPDIGPELIRNDRQADAQIEGLQHYIREVCLAE